MRLRAPQKIFHFFEKKLLTIFQDSVECPQIEATTAETKTKNQNEKMKLKKTTKTELRNAVDSFNWLLSHVTGGTREEVLRQAPTAIISLQEKANEIAGFLKNLSKPALRDEWLCDYASRIPSRLEEYRRLYLPA